MQLTTALALTSIFAAAVKAQSPMSIPSQQELQSEAMDLFSTNKPVLDSLTAYYATHTFSTGSRLASWVSKFQTMDIGTVNPTQDLSQQQILLIKSAYAEIPMSEVSDLLYQYFPTSIVGQITEIEDGISQFANYITATQDSTGEEVTSSSDVPAKTTSAGLASSSNVSAKATSTGSVKPSSTAAENSVISSAPISSSIVTTSHETTVISSSHSSSHADSSSNAVSASASTSASSTALQSNAAAHMTLSATVVLGLSGAVAALALI